MTWTILTLRDSGEDLLLAHMQQPQKGYQKGEKGTGDLLYNDQVILNENKARRKMLSWRELTIKSHDMFLQSWIAYCSKMYKIFDIKFNMEAMKNYYLELRVGEKTLER